MLLLLDNYDSFTYNLKDYFEQLGEVVKVIKNDEMTADELQTVQFDKLVLSPGPKTPKDAGFMMSIIDAFHSKVPILGICLGHQALGEFFGAKLSHAIQPMHGKVSSILHYKEGVYKGLHYPLNVCRYHSLILKNLDHTPLVQTAQTFEGECMSFVHLNLPITGLQYHPEAILTDKGLAILKNWLETI